MSINKYNPVTGELELLAGGVSNTYAPIGAIYPYGGSSAPSGYLLCDGAAVSRTDYAALFAVIGTSFGAGDGSTTFNVPDLREATTKGVGLSGKSSNHYDSDGVALGEFVEDRVQEHIHGAMKRDSSSQTLRDFVIEETGIQQPAENKLSYSDYTYISTNTGRSGTTTEVKAVGVNYIIKAKDVNLSVGGQALADRVSALETLTSDVIPSEASANNQLATENDIPDISGKQDKTLETPLTIGGTSQTTVEGVLSALNSEVREKISTTRCKVPMRDFKIKTWSGLTSFIGNRIWTDGDNIYYSDSSNQYVLDKSTSTWTAKTWTGLTKFSSDKIWTDGDNIYYSDYSMQYVLDKSTSTWISKTWTTGQMNLIGDSIWTDGDNIYYSEDSSHYVLDKSTSTWTTKAWSGLTIFNAFSVWTDGDNVYCSEGSSHYVLNKSTSTWTTKTWSGLTSFIGDRIWTDGDNIYYSDSSNQYVLDKSTSTWTAKTWTGLPNFRGDYIWTDGDNVYYSNGSDQYTLNKYLTKM